MLKVADWMTKNPITIEEDASIIEAVHRMKEAGVRRLPVMRNGRFVGLLTDRIVKEYTPSRATCLDTWEIHYLLSKTPIKDAMNDQPFTVTPETDLVDAAELIKEHKLHGLCVVDAAGDLVGILTTVDILRALLAICRQPELLK
ncbi:MAG: CBS domain-containing protein [Desulfuromonas sp.]|nr:CBS domain-containing protein [Desulfuromonas sp.]